MIKPEKTINGTKWIETIQINAEERATLEDQYGIDEDIIEYVTDNDESTNCPFEDNFVEYRVRPMLFFYFLLYQKQVWKNPKIFPDLLCF